ncbi:hypothetical protein G6M40_10190 [Agrobacterium tumefaciens]|uniref:Uncharacterized protein n=1 Tax=Agrobacterium tumefaciens TaxID=358 RepID=A0AA44F5V5_AGRTU|nr:hypothetical protein [Agrobacterium tumefaciens]NTB83770.1 hypothetical protein [Agrobacterium tumefaciens]NTC20761.1 hypothetical protein [Agrobacterium tumefaciens]NTC29241.1 hypothetical protein [Agrobacterium tumefaciens]NTC57521.1 hypothetical protein [Agrobacterium tumefaciens]
MLFSTDMDDSVGDLFPLPQGLGRRPFADRNGLTAPQETARQEDLPGKISLTS